MVHLSSNTLIKKITLSSTLIPYFTDYLYDTSFFKSKTSSDRQKRISDS